MCVHKVSRRNNFFWHVQKDKKYGVERYLKALKFVFFTVTKENIFFHKTLCLTHTFASMHEISFEVFDILKHA